MGCHAHHAPAGQRVDLAGAASGDERIDVLARGCARIASCAHDHDLPRFRDPGACVEYWLEHLEDPGEPVPACLSAAASCADVAACLHGAPSERAAAFCAAHPETVAACDGDALVSCARDDPSESTLTLCGALGATCGEVRAAGGLVHHGCLAPSLCGADVTHARCDGDAAVLVCHDQVLERAPCRPGTACHAHTDPDGEELATCEGPVEVTCAKVGDRRCRGGSLVRCELHGHHAREEVVDCGALGLACGDVAGRAACTAGEAKCAGGGPRCEHDALVFCAAGRTERVACVDLGLGPCETEGRGPVALCGSGRSRPAPR